VWTREIGLRFGESRKTNIVAFTIFVGISAVAILTIGHSYANVCPGSGLLFPTIGILEIFRVGAQEIQIQIHLTRVTCS
jgi:hypothetical protein